VVRIKGERRLVIATWPVSEISAVSGPLFPEPAVEILLSRSILPVPFVAGGEGGKIITGAVTDRAEICTCTLCRTAGVSIESRLPIGRLTHWAKTGRHV